MVASLIWGKPEQAPNTQETGNGVYIYIYVIILRLHLSVRVCVCVCVYEREVTGSHWTRAKKFSFSASLGLGRYNRQPTDTAGYGPSRDLNEPLQNDSGAELD